MWTAIFTAVLALFTCFLYQVSNRTDETLRAVQRAFVVSNGFQIFRAVEPGTSKILGWNVMPVWENSGTTPTRNLIAHVNSDWPAEQLPADFKFFDKPPCGNIRFVLGPKATVASSPLNVPAEIIRDAVVNKTRHVYFWGWASYKDIFPESENHITRFCYEVTGSFGDVEKTSATPPYTGAAAPYLLLSACSTNNCSDDECPDRNPPKCE